MKKTLIAAATALTIGLGAVGASTTSASAANVNGYIAGPGFSIGFGNGRPGWHQPQCKPIFKTQKVWSPRHGWTWAKVKVGQRCERPGWGGGHPGWNPGPWR